MIKGLFFVKFVVLATEHCIVSNETLNMAKVNFSALLCVLLAPCDIQKT